MNYPGPEKYRERRNSVPRKANNWQEGKDIFHEKSGVYMVFWSVRKISGHNSDFTYIYNLKIIEKD